MAARAAHTAFYDRELYLYEGQTMWDDPLALNAGAEVLSVHAKHLEEWASGVPSALRTNRQNGGRALSTDDSPLEIEQFAPLWLQRQRLLLELVYHHLCINLYRPMISFVSLPPPEGQVEEIATRCASHAIALSRITQQVLSSTSILDGWHEAFQWQWSAALALAGFVLVYPRRPLAKAARSAIDLSLSVFDTFGANFDVAANAAKIMRDLCAKVDFLTAQSGGQHLVSSESEPAKNAVIGADALQLSEEPLMGIGASMAALMDETSNYQEFSYGSNVELFDMAMDIDFWGNADMLWPMTDTVPVPSYSASIWESTVV
jgi:hypothetical protein